MRATLVSAICFMLALGGAQALAQEEPGDVLGTEAQASDAEPQNAEATPELQSAALLTIDLDRLFVQSDFGRNAESGYNAARRDLAEENTRIAEQLRREELALAIARPDMEPADFQSEADAFDAKAQSLRQAQDAKEQAIEADFQAAREAFLSEVEPLLRELMEQAGAVAILDRRAVLLPSANIDITDRAILLINQRLGARPPEPTQQP